MVPVAKGKKGAAQTKMSGRMIINEDLKKELSSSSDGKSVSSDEQMDQVINQARKELEKYLINDADYDTKLVKDKWYT